MKAFTSLCGPWFVFVLQTPVKPSVFGPDSVKDGGRTSTFADLVMLIGLAGVPGVRGEFFTEISSLEAKGSHQRDASGDCDLTTPKLTVWTWRVGAV